MGEERRKGCGEEEGGVLDCFKASRWFGFLFPSVTNFILTSFLAEVSRSGISRSSVGSR